MAHPDKESAVAEIKESIQKSSVAIMSKYQGITVAQVTDLRNKLRAQGVTYKVYKNTLAKRALDELGIGDAAKYMDGPTAWAFSADPVAPAKVLKEFGATVKVVVNENPWLNLSSTVARWSLRKSLMPELRSGIFWPVTNSAIW